MRRCVIAMSIVSLFWIGAPVIASTETTGSILLPSAGAARVQRCVATTDPASGYGQGVAGWTLPVTAGMAFTLTAEDGISDFDIAFYSTLTPCAQGASSVGHTNVTGDEQGMVPVEATVGIITLYAGVPAASFTYREMPPLEPQIETATNIDAFTVVAVVDGGFTPYHYDFLGHQHPRNIDPDPTNDFDFTQDPSTYIEGFPGASAINITIPTSTTQDISTLKSDDEAEWSAFTTSNSSNVNMYWFPGTKIIGALSFSGNFYANASSHGTRSAASAAGNLHGTCPECLFVLVNGATTSALAWAASQPWIDVVTNSYGHSIVGGFVRDNIYFGAPLDETRDASERGQTIVFSAGNGLVNAFDVPMLTYWSSEKGPDWMITVGAVDPQNNQQYSGAGKPVDISSIGSGYPSTGGDTATGTGTHSGTSNAAPTVAGTIARTIQKGREALADTTSGNAGGILASGPPFACGSANPGCPLADGVLTRGEVQDTVFKNVLPSDFEPTLNTVWPSTTYNYYYQGHGVVIGRSQSNEAFRAEQDKFVDALRGDRGLPVRPAGETNWFVIDSKCRQRLWGTWTGGYYRGADPVLDALLDPFAYHFNEWCSRMQQDAFRNPGDV